MRNLFIGVRETLTGYFVPGRVGHEAWITCNLRSLDVVDPHPTPHSHDCFFKSQYLTRSLISDFRSLIFFRSLINIFRSLVFDTQY